jgi:hypothetical protein
MSLKLSKFAWNHSLQLDRTHQKGWGLQGGLRERIAFENPDGLLRAESESKASCSVGSSEGSAIMRCGDN